MPQHQNAKLLRNMEPVSPISRLAPWAILHHEKAARRRSTGSTTESCRTQQFRFGNKIATAMKSRKLPRNLVAGKNLTKLLLTDPKIVQGKGLSL
jgi:hypothetical protein